MSAQNAFTSVRPRGADTAPAKAPRKTSTSKAPMEGNVHLTLDRNGSPHGEPVATGKRHHHRNARAVGGIAG